MITEKKILREVDRYKSTERIITMKTRQTELRTMIDQYGIRQVSVASGLSVTTLQQYLRTTLPNIGHEPVAQAKAVFSKLK